MIHQAILTRAMILIGKKETKRRVGKAKEVVKEGILRMY